MEIPGLGQVAKDRSIDTWYRSEPIPVPALGGKPCRIIVERYFEDTRKEDFHAAITNFLSINGSVLKAAERDLFQYYQDCNENWEPDDPEFLQIESPSELWAYVQFGSEPVVTRRAYGDKGVYVSLECSCDWEEEHGLQIVFKNGQTVNKLGQYDGHLTNSDAFADDSLENVVYPPR